VPAAGPALVSRPELWVVSQRRELWAASLESLQPVAAPELASAQRRPVLADAHPHAAVSHHACRVQPEVHSADAVVRAQSKAHRRAVSRSMEPVLRQESAASARLSELRQEAEALAQP
jgi:hypothetical protein